jgi:hypothetical protein
MLSPAKETNDALTLRGYYQCRHPPKLSLMALPVEVTIDVIAIINAAFYRRYH